MRNIIRNPEIFLICVKKHPNLFTFQGFNYEFIRQITIKSIINEV